MNNDLASIDAQLIEYIEGEIIPRYRTFDKAHSESHARQVITRSIALAHNFDTDAAMVYIIAAYHDLGLCEGRERHHIASGEILMADTRLRQFFSEEQIAELTALAEKSLVFRSSNMSVGINVIMDILPQLTALLGEAYDVEMTEIHHNKKKDAPSGTALLLAEPLLKARGLSNADINTNRFDVREPRKHDEIGIQSLRGGDVVGVHTVYYMGPGERIELTHHAHSRENFANGALRAARWISSQTPGRVYNMQDVLHS